MPLLLLSILGTLAGAFPFGLRTVPLPQPHAHVFLAQADRDVTADVFVLDGSMLTAYPDAGGGTPFQIELLPGTSAFDIVDLDRDGEGEVVAVCGDRIMRYPLSGGKQPVQPEELFSLTTQLGGSSAQPYPCVLAVQNNGGVALALPTEDTLEVRNADGALVAGYPGKTGPPGNESYGWPFSVWPIEPPQVGRLGALEVRVTRVVELAPDLPDDFLPDRLQSLPQRRGTFSQMRDAAGLDPTTWMWFPLLRNGGGAKRVLFALAGDTLIRLREEQSSQRGLVAGGVKIGPERRYPGTLILPDGDLPDFNGDGFVDLLLWSAPGPGVSIDSLTRVVTSRTWPIRLTVHLFAPDKNRYEPRPAGQVTARVPLPWFFMLESGAPLRNCILRDFDGDGRTDLAVSVSESTFAVWLYQETGFAGNPDQTFSFPERLSGVEFVEDLDGVGRASVALRTQKSVHILYAAPE